MTDVPPLFVTSGKLVLAGHPICLTLSYGEGVGQIVAHGPSTTLMPRTFLNAISDHGVHFE
jgi:hypothetical protein